MLGRFLSVAVVVAMVGITPTSASTSASHSSAPDAVPLNIDVGFTHPRLYVATDGGEKPAINVYHQDARFPEPLYQITSGLEYGASQMAMDASGRLYVADPDAGVLEYAPHGTSPLRTLDTLGRGLYDASGVALDGAGIIHVVTANGSQGAGYLLEYHRNATRPFLVVPGFAGASELALDAAGDTFVIEHPASGARIVELSAGSQSIQPVSLIGVTDPISMEFSPDGDLFVSDGALEAILAFHPGSTRPYKRFASHAQPGCLTFDATGMLYVSESGQVALFHPGQFHSSKLVRIGLSQGAGPLAVFPPYDP